MSKVPDHPKIYHITHATNLPGVISEGGLWSDLRCADKSVTATNIGHRHIKERRKHRNVPPHPGTVVGEYVPFNFCPRSVMLFAVSKGIDDYRGGQTNVVHLVSTVDQAVSQSRRWAFTDRHADLDYTLYYSSLDDLSEVPWGVMDKGYWKDDKEERQAEFLVHEFFPWTEINEIGVLNAVVESKVRKMLENSEHQPLVSVEPKWYY